MKKLIKRILPLALCLSMLFTLTAMAAANDTLLIASAPAAAQAGALKAGAGAAEITFNNDIFPCEGFDGSVHLNPYVRVLILEQETKMALVFYETVNVPSDVIASAKQIVGELAGIPGEQVWVHATHAITTLHAPDDTAKRALFVSDMLAPLKEAAKQAVATFQPAKMGVATGELDVNANRGVEINGAWYYGLNSTMPSNKKMTVLSFADMNDNPIGFFISYGIKPTAIDNVEMKANTRKISSDIPGVACRMMEEKFGVPAMFAMPCCGDQIPKEAAMFHVDDGNGGAKLIELSVAEGIEIVDRLGDEMGDKAIEIAKSIQYTGKPQKIVAEDTSFTWSNKNGDGEVTIDVRGMTIGDEVALIGIKPETNAITEQQLWEASPYKHTLVLSFLDGDQKYMPDKQGHELKTWEFKRSGTASGSAEKFVEVATGLLTDIKARESSALKAGAGAAEITFPDAMFPVEGFNGSVHMNPYVRVLLLERETKMAIVDYETVNVPSDVIASAKKIVGEMAGIAEDQVWVHATHAITTPHAPDDTAKRELFVEAMLAPLKVAAKQAVETFQYAQIGVGTGDLDVNANRGVEINGAWYYGLNSTMPSNKKMTIISFADLEGKPIGFFISYGIKPTAIDNVEMKANTRKLSSDVPGVACRMMEEKFGVPAMFAMPCCGDQIPKEAAMFHVDDGNGGAKLIELSVAEGIEIVERLGDEMGDKAIEIAESIKYTTESQKIVAADTAFTWSNKNGDGEVTIDVRGMTIGDEIALIGIKPETNAITEQQLWEASPYKHTLVLSFLDGDQKYMPDKQGHELKTWEFKRSGTASGSAEKFVEVAADLLKGIRAGEITTTVGKTAEGGTEAGAAAVKTIQMAGVEWYVLEEQQGKALVVSKNVLEARAYHAPGGAVTWEGSEIRAYLNGEFYNKFFSAEEKAKIIETKISNPSNSQYGIVGGNDTTDKVFLLSLNEAEKYMGSGVELLRGIDINTKEVTWWHLRSPGEATNVAASVNAIGLIDYHGVYDGVQDPTGGIRPAMWINTGDVAIPAEKPAEQPTPAPAGDSYTVAAGDCLWSIAAKVYGNGALYAKLAAANGIADPYVIYVGQVLTVPAK